MHLGGGEGWQEALWPLPDQLAPLLGSVAIQVQLKPQRGLGMDICSNDSLPVPLPVPSYPL